MKQKEINIETLPITSTTAVKNKMCKKTCQSCKTCALKLRSIAQEKFKYKN